MPKLIFNFFFALALIDLTACSSISPHKYNAVQTGLENFITNYADDYKNKKALLITNHSGLDRFFEHNIFLLRQKEIIIKELIAPEHGLYGYQNDYAKRKKFFDKNFNVLIYNAHQLNKKKFLSLISKNDFVIFDIQDLGIRCYTYISNLKNIIDFLNINKKELVILDRPNPLSLLGVNGSDLNPKYKSKFISSFPAPLFYDLTIGEAALYYKNEFKPSTKLTVIPMKNYKSGMNYIKTELPWVPPSPNLPTYQSTLFYAATVLMEGINISLGRGTPKPFEYLGAPWIKPFPFCQRLIELDLENFAFRPIYFKPTLGLYKDQLCGGAHLFYKGGKFNPIEISYKITKFILKNYVQAKWRHSQKKYKIDFLSGSDLFRKHIDQRKDLTAYQKKITAGIKNFRIKQKKYRLY